MRAVRVLLTTLLVCAGALLPGLLRPGVAAADEPAAYVSINLTSMTPALPSRDDTITLTGRITNTSKVQLSNLQAIFWRSLDPIQDAAGMDRALASAADEPFGERVPDRYQNVPSDENRVLAAGQSAPFTLTAKVSELDLPSSDGVFLIGVHVRGQAVADGPNVTLGRGRVFVPVVTDEPTNTLKLTSVVVMTSRPSFVRKGILADDHLADEVAPGGRLTALLDSAEQTRMNYAVDPELIETLQTMRGGYQVLQADGSTAAGPGQSDATRWLNDFAALPVADGFRLLYGSPDVAALVHGGQQKVLTRAASAGDDVAATASLPLLVLPTDGRADTETVTALEALDPAAILLSDASAQGTSPVLAGPGSAPIIIYSAEAFGGGPGPDPRNTAVQLRQRMLADGWIEAETSAPGATLGRVRLITDAAQAKGDTADVKAPWMERASLSTLLRSTPASWTQRFGYSDNARSKELSPVQLGRIARLARSYTVYADVLVEPASAIQAGDAALARAASGSWRSDPDVGAGWWSTQQAELDQFLRDDIGLTANPKVTSTSKRGFFPITIRNRLAAPAENADPDINAIKVAVTFASDNSQRLNVADLRDAPPVPAQQNFTGNAQVDAKTNGTVRVVAQLRTPSGYAVGRPVRIDVNASQAGTAGWVIAIGAGIVLIGTTTLRIRQVARERAKTEPPPPSALTSAPPEDPEPTDPTDPTEPGRPASRESLDV